MTHPTLIGLLLLCYSPLQTYAFLGYSWGSEQPAVWDVCAPESSPRHPCSCPDDLLTASSQGLDCSRRQLQELRDGVVIPLRFRKLDFSGNNIASVTAATFASNNTHVTALDLSANNLRTLQAGAFSGLSNLRSLDLRNNVIKHLDNQSLSGLPNLTTLDLGYNQIHFLPDLLFSNCTGLTVLLLLHNPLSTLSDGVFRGLTALTHLDLTYLPLKFLHAQTFQDNSRLEKLELVHNNLEQIPTKALFQLAPSLKMLDLSGNNFKTLPAYSLYNLPHLEELRMQQMIYLVNIEAYAFNELSNLQTVVLKYLPKLLYIDEKAFSSQQINGSDVRSPVQDFTLSFTVLTRLPEHLLDWQNLKFIDLQRNHWNCDCNLAWVKGSALENLAGEQFYCFSPGRVHGALLPWLKKEDFVCKAGDSMPDGWQWSTYTLLILVAVLVSLATVSILFYQRNGYVCRARANYNKLEAQSRESISVVDTTVD